MRVKFVLGSPLLRFIYEENVLDASDILLLLMRYNWK